VAVLGGARGGGAIAPSPQTLMLAPPIASQSGRCSIYK